MVIPAGDLIHLIVLCSQILCQSEIHPRSPERGQVLDESPARTPETNLIGSFLADWCPFLLDINWCLDVTADQSRQINHNPIQM